MTPRPFLKGEVVYWKEEGEYVVVEGDVWDVGDRLVRVCIPRCGESEVVAPSAIRHLSKKERGR